MLTRILPKSTTRASTAVQRCLSVRYNSSVTSQPPSAVQDEASPIPETSPQNEPLENGDLPPGFTEYDTATLARPGLKPTPPYQHPISQYIDPKLPNVALRSLFTLHHAARNFITPQNLDKAIDMAFATSNFNRHPDQRHYKNLKDLENEVEARRLEDRQRPWRTAVDQEHKDQQRTLREVETYGPAGMRTTDGANIPVPTSTRAIPSIRARDAEIRAALYGVVQSGGVTLPTLDSLEDEIAAKKARREAKQAQRNADRAQKEVESPSQEQGRESSAP